MGYSYMYVHGALLTDGDGRYRMTGLPSGVGVWFESYKNGDVQQCAAAPVTLQGDLAMASRSSRRRTSRQQPRRRHGVSDGVRHHRGDDVRRQATRCRGVRRFRAARDFPAAVTYSDGAGRFALCGLSQDEKVRLGTSSGGRVAYASIPPGQTAGVEILRSRTANRKS